MQTNIRRGYYGFIDEVENDMKKGICDHTWYHDWCGILREAMKRFKAYNKKHRFSYNYEGYKYPKYEDKCKNY